MDIKITEFFKNAEPMNYSASCAEYGDNVGTITWNNAKKDSYFYELLVNDEQREYFREHVQGFGAWDKEEIDSWPDQELTAIFMQIISADMRESGLDEYCFDDIDWEEYQEGVEKGRYSGRIYLGVDGEVYYYLGR